MFIAINTKSAYRMGGLYDNEYKEDTENTEKDIYNFDLLVYGYFSIFLF